MKGSLCTLPKIREGKWGGGKKAHQSHTIHPSPCTPSLESSQLRVIIFGLVWFLSKKSNTEFFFKQKKWKPNRNRFKPTGFGLVWVFRTKTGLNQFGSVFSGLTWFFQGFFYLGSARFCFFHFQVYKTKTEPNRSVFF